MNRIRELRKKNNLTQKALGELMGYSESTCSLYECGKRQPDTKTLVFLANHFNVSVDYILGRTDESEVPAGEADREQKGGILSCFSIRLAQERKKLGYTQKELSKKSGVSQQAISMIEAGKRSPTEITMIMLANGLGCSVEYMLCESSGYGINSKVKSMSFSDGMLKRRKELRISQIELSKRCGVAQSTISAVESGARKPTEETMLMIASGLGCSIGYLLGEIPEYGKPADQLASGKSENEMLNLFRQLSLEEKEYVRGILEGLLAAHKL